jgi:methyltransferase (TIGR00027 family)
VISDVSDTAFLVAYQRALELEAPDPLVRDPHARALAGERGRLVAESLPPGSLQGWPIIVRARVYDEMIVEAVRSGEVDAVLNLGAGLDARPYRLDLPKALAWVEADLPAVIHYKTAVLSSAVPGCHLERCAVDLTDTQDVRALLWRVAGAHRRVLVLTEGVLGYLAESTVAALADSLRAVPAIGLWASELLSHSLLPDGARLAGGAFRAARIVLRFAPAEGVRFFVERGWRPRRVLPFFDEAARLGRGPVLSPEERRALRDSSLYLLLESAG